MIKAEEEEAKNKENEVLRYTDAQFFSKMIYDRGATCQGNAMHGRWMKISSATSCWLLVNDTPVACIESCVFNLSTQQAIISNEVSFMHHEINIYLFYDILLNCVIFLLNCSMGRKRTETKTRRASGTPMRHQA